MSSLTHCQGIDLAWHVLLISLQRLSLSLSLALASHLTRKQQGKDPIAIIALAIPPRQSVYFLLHLASALTLTLLVKRPAVDRYAAG